MAHNQDINDVHSQTIYTIPAYYPFLDTLARGILEDYADKAIELRHLRILLPTRRACRNLRNAFLRVTDGQPFILPQLVPIGDLDEDELKLTALTLGKTDEITAIKPAISPLRRRLLLAQLIQKIPDQHTRPEQAIALADSLARLIDNVHNENLSFEQLTHLVSDEFATHWQITLNFLEIIRLHWPAILEEEGCVDPADRRNQLIALLLDLWRAAPPSHPIIAAGITGSMPSTASLLKMVSCMEYGQVILPGLDPYIDILSWDNLDNSHPQSGFHRLLGFMGAEREDVHLWPHCEGQPRPADYIQDRLLLASEMMRPAQSCHLWARMDQDVQKRAENALHDIKMITAKTEQEEAEKISLLLRETLEDPSKTAIVVTPDRSLARRIGAAMRRWDIQLDDSAGTPMHYTRIGGWLQTSAAFLIEQCRPLPFLNFMHHQLAACGMDDKDIAPIASAFDQYVLRGAAPLTGFDGLRERIHARLKDERITPSRAQECSAFLDHLQSLTVPFYELVETGKHDFSVWLDAHIEIAKALAAQPEKSGAARLWSGEDGEEIAAFLAELKRQVYNLPKVSGESYMAILVQLMRSISVRPLYGTHPRLQILGQLEARMIGADVMILAGLNEGTWPADPGHDPWMSRPMRAEFGLPALEQSIGQAAHDFVQCFAAPKLYFSRAERKDGAPTVSSRWLLRLNAVLQATGHVMDDLNFPEINAWHEALCEKGEKGTQLQKSTAPYTRPEPRPPVAVRPNGLAVTSIGKWMRDPYSIYARKILRLSKLDPIEKDASNLDQGNFLHKVLERFVKAHPVLMPPDAKDLILTIAQDLKEEWPEAKNIPSFWWPRLERGLDWFIDHENSWRKSGAMPWKMEETGHIEWEGFSLSGTADRIDARPDGSQVIIDYKTGSLPEQKDIRAGYEPQMPLEAIILDHAGFGDKSQTGDLQFWRITGGQPPAEVKSFSKNIAELVDEAADGLSRLIKAFESADTPYYSLPDLSAAPPEAWQDYAHLARVAEWEMNEQKPEGLQDNETLDTVIGDKNVSAE